jgi:hypothetical protein
MPVGKVEFRPRGHAHGGAFAAQEISQLPALATKEKNLSAFFKRAYGKKGQAEQDKYITELANMQSQLALKSGDQFCRINASMFDQLMSLSTVEQLASYAQNKPIQQALVVDECSTAPTPKATPRKKGQQTAAR